MKIRLIIASEPNGDSETIQFTKDFDNDVDYFLRSEQTTDFDKVLELDLPSIFPLEYTFIRQ